MGRSAYWKAGVDSLASNALGDANRGAFLALQSAVSTRRRPVATDPPERRASSCQSSRANVVATGLLRPLHPLPGFSLAWAFNAALPVRVAPDSSSGGDEGSLLPWLKVWFSGSCLHR